MLQQAMRIEPAVSSEDTIEDALQQIGPPSIAQISPTRNGWSYWSSILSQQKPIGFPMMKSPEEITQAGKDTIDALTKSSTALTEGYSEISRHIIAATHKSVATHLTTGKEVFDIKTPSDWLEFQSKWVGDLLNTAVSHMTQLSKLSTKVVNETYEPLKTHFGKLGGFI